MLTTLQGVCIPRILGAIEASGDAYMCAMRPPHHHRWQHAHPLLPEAAKKNVIEAYHLLHTRGVLHGDAALRHIIIGKSDLELWPVLLAKTAIADLQ